MSNLFECKTQSMVQLYGMMRDVRVRLAHQGEPFLFVEPFADENRFVKIVRAVFVFQAVAQQFVKLS